MEIATGITVDFATGFLAELIDVTPPGASRGSVQTSHQGTTDNAHTFTPTKLVDWGEFGAEIGFDPGADPPIDSDAEEITLTFPSGETWVFDGFMTGYEPSAPLEDRMTATCTIKVSGLVAVTDAS